MVQVDVHLEPHILASFADERVIVNGLADALQAKRDQDAAGDHGDMDSEVFEAVNGALRSVEFHGRSV
jgi:hypothetical protein